MARADVLNVDPHAPRTLTSENDVWLSIIGPDGVRQFLGETLSRTPQRLPGA
jgi:hypothetical protein